MAGKNLLRMILLDLIRPQYMKKFLVLFAFLISSPVWANIPATPVMTLYRFNGALEIPYYHVDSFQESGPGSPAGTLAQGSSLIPCLVIKNGRPLTNSNGTPYVGFNLIVDSLKATPASTDKFKETLKSRQNLKVPNHHCESDVKHVFSIKNLYVMKKAPFFDPKREEAPAKGKGAAKGDLDTIVRAFHDSPQCAGVQRRLVGRRGALEQAWEQFIAGNQGQWSGASLEKAKHLDYTMRTAIYEGHLDRGCNAYGACERNIVALSIRNRARGYCKGWQGCSGPGDFQGVASKVSQYNIWDEYLTQISGLSSCFLRSDLVGDKYPYYEKIKALYEQNQPQVETILFGTDQELRQIFPSPNLNDLKNVRHYYHAPAMGKCFPNHDRVEYMSGAIAKKGSNFALIANTRIQVGQKTDGGYFFKDFVFTPKPDKDQIDIVDTYPGFVVDERKISLRQAKTCLPYGVPRGCPFKSIGRYRKAPSWLRSGKPLEISCRVKDRGSSCKGKGVAKLGKVGGVCDTEMKPVAGVP